MKLPLFTVTCECGYTVEDLLLADAERFAGQHEDDDHETGIRPTHKDVSSSLKGVVRQLAIAQGDLRRVRELAIEREAMPRGVLVDGTPFPATLTTREVLDIIGRGSAS